jgi:hypothetical protein
MNEFAWNNVIWLAIQNLSNLRGSESRYFSIDEIFFTCEKELCALNAPEREIELRLFALALYCDKTYGSAFFKSMFFLRYALALDFLHFERTAKILIEENNFAIVVFWTVFRLSFGNSIPRNSFITLEKEMRNKSLELGLKIQSFSK